MIPLQVFEIKITATPFVGHLVDQSMMLLYIRVYLSKVFTIPPLPHSSCILITSFKSKKPLPGEISCLFPFGLTWKIQKKMPQYYNYRLMLIFLQILNFMFQLTPWFKTIFTNLSTPTTYNNFHQWSTEPTVQVCFCFYLPLCPIFLSWKVFAQVHFLEVPTDATYLQHT